MKGKPKIIGFKNTILLRNLLIVFLINEYAVLAVITVKWAINQHYSYILFKSASAKSINNWLTCFVTAS